MRIAPALLLVLLWTTSTCAAPAISCHCFQERTFDPQHPAAADPYLLATTQNSLFAAVFGLEKKDVVRVKMAGASAAELWVTRFVAARAGLAAEVVARARSGNPTWQATLATLGLPPERLGSAFTAALADPGTPAALASAAVDDTLVAHFGADPAELRQLRAAGAGDAEAILAVFLSRESGRPASSYWVQVSKGKQSWGELLTARGLPAQEIEEEVRRLLR